MTPGLRRLRFPATACLIVTAALAVQQCGRVGAGSGGEPPYKPVATIDQVMDGIVIPSSQAIFDAVVYSNGELVVAPETDNDWFALQMHALAVAEAGNLLIMPPRAKDSGDWRTFSLAMTEQATRVARAAEAKNTDRLLDTGSELYNTCTACHEKYVE